MNSKTASSTHLESSDKVQHPAPIEAAIGVTSEVKEPNSQAHEVDGKKGKKRKGRSEDEIDQLFDEKLGKKTKRAVLEADAGKDANMKSGVDRPKKTRDVPAKDRELADILGAIRAAPQRDGGHRSKKK